MKHVPGPAQDDPERTSIHMDNGPHSIQRVESDLPILAVNVQMTSVSVPVPEGMPTSLNARRSSRVGAKVVVATGCVKGWGWGSG